MPGQTPILTITLNPALDVDARFDGAVRPGPKLRLGRPGYDPGGGGVNVARAIRRLGGEAVAAAALGGPTGARIADLMQAEGLVPAALPAPGETRQSLTVNEAATGDQYRFVLPGPDWPPQAVDDVLAALSAATPPGAIVVLSGSQPPGVPDDFAATLAAVLAPAGARLIVDTSGAALTALASPSRSSASRDAAPEVLRMDEAEAETLAGRPLPEVADTAAFAGELVAAGVARVVVLARGANGSVLVGAGRRLHCIPPVVRVQSKVGAGDSFTGAVALSLARAEGWAEALRQGTAAAAAAVMTPATELCRPGDVVRLGPECRLIPLPGDAGT
ncbi:1-phosphofructokinase family hexose kinase [Halodurantibacterium flavum]|uniref:Phosphofructokinase n=1 Tax=Halodurantibacterium flavum TaxID=1382802 RepID=A0ABW4S636_9RHOB